MRLFVAVIPPQQAREAALEAARSLRWEGKVRWLPQQNVHLTLKFLGETGESLLPDLELALKSVCGRHGAFDLSLEGVGAFPSVKRARTLWAGVGQGAEPLSALAEDTEQELEPLGFEREKRPFHPHATVGRAKGARLAGPPEPETGAAGFRVSSVGLAQSRLSERGAIYTVASTFALAG